MVVQVQVHGPKQKIVNVDLCENEEQLKTITVRQLKEKIKNHFPISDCVHLVYADKKLREDRFLTKYGIRHMSVIHMVLELPGGGGDPPPKGDGGMGDKDDKHRRSMERLATM